MKDDRLISLNAAIDALNKRWRTCIIGESLIRDAKDTLKELPSATDTNVGGNLIDRAAALSALNGLTEIYLNNLPSTIYKSDAVDAIKALPPAQPSVSKTEIVEDCISRAAVLNLIEQSCCDLEYDCDNVALRKEVEALPSAQPETCEGCKHLGKWENEVEYGYPSPCTRCKRRVGDHYEK